MKLPRGYRLCNARYEDGRLTYDLKVARWRVALMVWRIFRRESISVRGPR